MSNSKVKQLKLKGIRLRKDSEDMKNLASIMPTTFENNLTEKPLSFKFLTVLITISEFASPSSVISNGFETPNDLQASDKSLILFSPTQIEVG